MIKDHNWQYFEAVGRRDKVVSTFLTLGISISHKIIDKFGITFILLLQESSATKYIMVVLADIGGIPPR